jgi:capsid portal protein
MRILSRLFGRSKPSAVQAFSFGDPVPVLDGNELLGYLECIPMGKWYAPPMPWEGIARSYRAAVHHSAALQLKRNVLSATYIPHKLLSRAAFTRWVDDFLIFGNGYLERRKNRLGGTLRLEPPLSKYVRRGLDLESFWYVPDYQTEHQFQAGTVFHLAEPDINQDIYGLPYYLSGLNSAWLNESATLFRRKYYKNGSHTGFILYMTDTAQDQGDVDALRQALKDSKGPGNFRNLFMYAPNGKKDGIQIIPVADFLACQLPRRALVTPPRPRASCVENCAHAQPGAIPAKCRACARFRPGRNCAALCALIVHTTWYKSRLLSVSIPNGV